MKYLCTLAFLALFLSCSNLPEIEPESPLALVIYPNPSNKRIWIYVKNDMRSQFSLQIFDPDGKVVAEWRVPEKDDTNSFVLEPTKFGTGAFHAVLYKDGLVYTQKFMVL